MAQYIGPKYNITDFDASRWRDLMSNIFGTGVVKGGRPQGAAGGDLGVTNPSGLNYSVALGVAIIKGFLYVNDTAAVTGALGAADPTNPRIDTVIISWTYGSGVPTGVVAVVAGTPASSPVAPSLTQNDTTYQLPLADLRVNAGATTVATVTDRRSYAVALIPYAIGHAGGNIPISDGAVNTNLNADMVDGFHSGHAAGNVPVSDGVVNTNLNADMVDGYHASNNSGDVPISNGALNANLNAAMLGGQPLASLDAHTVQTLSPGHASGNVPVSDGTVNTNLNADMVDGIHATGFVEVGAGNLAALPVRLILVGPSSANLPAAGVKGRIAIVVPFSLP